MLNVDQNQPGESPDTDATAFNLVNFVISARQEFIQYAGTFGTGYDVVLPLTPDHTDVVPGWLHGLIMHLIAAEHHQNSVLAQPPPINPFVIQQNLSEQYQLIAGQDIISLLIFEFGLLPTDLQTSWHHIFALAPESHAIPDRWIILPTLPDFDPLDPEDFRLEQTRARIDHLPEPEVSPTSRRNSGADDNGDTDQPATINPVHLDVHSRSASPPNDAQQPSARQRSPLLPRSRSTKSKGLVRRFSNSIRNLGRSRSVRDRPVRNTRLTANPPPPSPVRQSRSPSQDLFIRHDHMPDDRDRPIEEILQDVGLNTTHDQPENILPDHTSFGLHNHPPSPVNLLDDSSGDSNQSQLPPALQPAQLAIGDDFLRLRRFRAVRTIDQIDLNSVTNPRASAERQSLVAGRRPATQRQTSMRTPQTVQSSPQPQSQSQSPPQSSPLQSARANTADAGSNQGRTTYTITGPSSPALTTTQSQPPPPDGTTNRQSSTPATANATTPASNLRRSTRERRPSVRFLESQLNPQRGYRRR